VVAATTVDPPTELVVSLLDDVVDGALEVVAGAVVVVVGGAVVVVPGIVVEVELVVVDGSVVVVVAGGLTQLPRTWSVRPAETTCKVQYSTDVSAKPAFLRSTVYTEPVRVYAT
jgi:hypothetical protein